MVVTVDSSYSDWSRQETELRDTLGLLGSVIDVGMFCFDLKTGELRCSPGLTEMWGVGHDGSLQYDDLLAAVHPDDRELCIKQRNDGLCSKLPYRTQYRIVRNDGKVRYIRGEGKFIFDEEGRTTSNVGAAVDVTSQVEAEKKVLHLLEHDRLTDLFGRNAFIERLQQAVLHHKEGEVFGVLVLDIDRFTDLNDTLGSATGDIVLRTFAKRLRILERDGHVVGRVGGDEFACLLRGLSNERQLRTLTAKVRSLIREPIEIAGTSLRASASLGLSVHPCDGNDISLLERAHLACRSAKNAGETNFSRFKSAMEAQTAKRYELETSLRSAVANQEFRLYYQPIVGRSKLDIIGVEALIRWDHPRLGLQTPDSFLPAARDIGIMSQIDAWALTRACSDGAALRRLAGPSLNINVNISAEALARADFVRTLQTALLTSGLPAENLVLEITEQSLIVDEPQTARKLAAIRSMGVKISIDDFGTGYNALSYLKAYPVDSIKIDRSFVFDLETSSFSRGVCSGMLSLAKNLNLRVVAEGVETMQQAQFLRTLGVEEMQGFLFGRPAASEALLADWDQSKSA